MNIKIIIGFFLLIVSLTAQARLFLDIVVLARTGIDENLTLTSEFHSVEEVWAGIPYQIKMGNDLRMILVASFVSNSKIYGPSSFLSITGEVFDKDGRLAQLFDKERPLVEIGGKKTLVYKKNNQRIEITFSPKIY